MALAAHASTIRIRASSGIGTSADDLDGCDSYALNRVRDELETTDFKSGADREFMAGLKGGEIPVECDLETGDTPQGRLATAFDDGTSVWAVLLWDGAAGKMVECKVMKQDHKAERDGKVRVSYSLKLTGAVAVAA